MADIAVDTFLTASFWNLCDDVMAWVLSAPSWQNFTYLA